MQHIKQQICLDSGKRLQLVKRPEEETIRFKKYIYVNIKNKDKTVNLNEFNLKGFLLPIGHQIICVYCEMVNMLRFLK